ncbi:MAG: alpha-1,2-fucosyltransferase [Rhizobiales bacterium]|nr:alpha-1,2-fucosyltransferase [Hyphomicrobiales bacterium]
MRRYELDRLAIQAARLNFLDKMALRESTQSLLRRFAPMTWPHKRMLFTTVDDRQVGFSGDVFLLKGNIYLRGFWQSWKYFSDIRSVLLREFSMTSPPNPANTSTMKRIEESCSVCIHVRRADYWTDPYVNSIFGVCPAEYYGEGIRLLKERLSQPTFFVFSDDLDWARENIKPDAPCVFVDCNKDKPGVHDMRLMTRCKHFIIANSSYSWWGAWLSAAPDKIVIAPEKWFKNNRSVSDLMPDDWIKLPNDLL